MKRGVECGVTGNMTGFIEGGWGGLFKRQDRASRTILDAALRHNQINMKMLTRMIFSRSPIHAIACHHR